MCDLCVRNSKKKSRITELREFNKVATHEIQYGKINFISIYQHKELENKVFLEDTIDYIIKNIKYLEMNLTKDMQNL